MRCNSIFATAAVLAGFLLPPAVRAAGQEWGTIEGQIVYAGDPIPKQNVIAAAAQHQDAKACLAKGPVLTEDWVVNPKNKGVRWILIWLDTGPVGPGQKKAQMPIHPQLLKPNQPKVTMDQPCCMFEPPVLGMREGQDLEVKNSAPVSHNVNWQGIGAVGLNTGGNVLIPAGGVFVIKDLKPMRYPLTITCNIHPWMKARVGVFDHPYFAVSDANGHFMIKDAPAGTFWLKVYSDAMGWRHGGAGKDGQKITIKPNAVTDLGILDVKPN